ncbi:hypothetical protein U1Q18_039834 [Sarracenia purpurea var. burkii]
MMDFGGYGGSSNGSGDEQENSNRRRGKKLYHRHTSYQIQQLEAFFKECPHPDDNQRRLLSRELGLEPKQIKFWFQNKRTQTKAQNERADNNALKVENERIQCENLAIREALKNVICPACGGAPFGEDERKLNLHTLKYERVSHVVSNFFGKSIGQIQSLSRSLDLQEEGFPAPGQGGIQLGLGGIIDSPDLDRGNSNNSGAGQFKQSGSREPETPAMVKAAVGAMDELIRLLRVNEPVWMKSPADGRYVLHRDSYNKLFPRANHFKSPGARMESSKDSGVVAMSAVQLLDMFLDPKKWEDLFPTIVTKARTIEVIDTRVLGDQAGCLQLVS